MGMIRGPINSGPIAPGSWRAPVEQVSECKQCEFCFTKLFGCTSSKCYCHTHDLEPAARALQHEPYDPVCIWNDPEAVIHGIECQVCRA